MWVYQDDGIVCEHLVGENIGLLSNGCSAIQLESRSTFATTFGAMSNGHPTAAIPNSGVMRVVCVANW